MSEQELAVPASNAETPAVESSASPVVPKTDDMSAKFAALAKKERIARLAQHNLKTKETSLAERERQIAERERMWEEEFKQSPLEAIKKRGYTYEDITKAALNDGKFEPATEIKSVRSELEKFRQEQAEKEKKALEEQQTAAQKIEQETVERFKRNISQTLEEKKDKYELTHLFDASDLVYQTIEEHFERTKKLGEAKVMSIEEACDLVEQFYENEIERTATSSKKFQAKYGAIKKEAEKEKPKSSTTLSNSLTPSSAAPSLLPVATENDRLKRALAALG